MEDNSNSSAHTELNSLSSERRLYQERIAQNKITFAFQIIAVYGIILAAVINLTVQHPDKELWLVLLSSSIGFILPNPGLKYKKRPTTYLSDREF